MFYIASRETSFNDYVNISTCVKGVDFSLGSPWKRHLTRLGVVAFLLFVALSVPRFGNIMDLVGASSITIINLIMPAVMYLLVMKNGGQVAHKNTVQLNSKWQIHFIQENRLGRKMLLLLFDHVWSSGCHNIDLHCCQKHVGNKVSITLLLVIENIIWQIYSYCCWATIIKMP